MNPLCLKDTIFQSANGILLKYDLCTYLAKKNLPVVHVFDLSSSTNDTNEPNLLMENRKGYRLVTLFEYRNNNEELLPDKILIPLVPNLFWPMLVNTLLMYRHCICLDSGKFIIGIMPLELILFLHDLLIQYLD